MRVRPATPLSIILLVAFTLLVLSVLSTPIIPSIHLAAYGRFTFGVFGFCTSGKCSGYRIGYDTSSSGLTDAHFTLRSGTRNSLTHLLIVHPIAALFTLILLVLSLLSHFHTPAHSPRYLLALLIFSLPTFLLSLLAFLADILIFLPHIEWGGWVVLGAAVLNALAGIITCGMRRSLVQKVARRNRIAGDVTMNSTKLYANEVPAVPPLPETVIGDKPPEFATFEVDKPAPGEPEGERIPLNPRSRTVSPPLSEDNSMGGASAFNVPSLHRAPSDRSDGYGPPPRGAGPLSRPMPPGQVRSQYSNQTLQSATTGSSGPYGVPPQRGYGFPGDGYSRDGYGGHQGGYIRGGPPPNGSGVFNPGGLGPPPRRGPGPNQFGPRGPPPPGVGGPYGGGGQYGMGPGMGPQNGMDPRNGMGPNGVMMMGPGQRRPMQPPPQQRESREYDYPEDQPNIDERQEFEQTLPTAALSGIGVAKTSDEYHDDDRRMPAELAADVERELTPPRLTVVNETRQDTPYDNEYVPPRAVWNSQTSSTPPPPQQSQTPPPIELPTAVDASPSHSGNSTAPRPSESYYEDVAPVFDNSHVPRLNSTHPPVLMPGGVFGSHATSNTQIPEQQLRSVEDLQDGQRSPAMSATSNFTSISQRPPNPNWQPGPPPPMLPGGMNQGRRGPTSSQLLVGNPDFELPSGRGGRFRGGGGTGMGR